MMTKSHPSMHLIWKKLSNLRTMTIKKLNQQFGIQRVRKNIMLLHLSIIVMLLGPLLYMRSCPLSHSIKLRSGLVSYVIMPIIRKLLSSSQAISQIQRLREEWIRRKLLVLQNNTMPLIFQFLQRVGPTLMSCSKRWRPKFMRIKKREEKLKFKGLDGILV